MTRRIERLNNLIRHEISELLQRQVKDPRLGNFVAVTEVSISPDLKYANDDFAKRMSKIRNYWSVITRNIKMAHDNGSGEMVIRHLVMPGRIEADTYPILEWCAEHVPKALVNVMGQYRPMHLVKKHCDKFSDINRGITFEELTSARNKAEELGILWRPVS